MKIKAQEYYDPDEVKSNIIDLLYAITMLAGEVSKEVGNKLIDLDPGLENMLRDNMFEIQQHASEIDRLLDNL